jgi:hypothetical protein
MIVMPAHHQRTRCCCGWLATLIAACTTAFATAQPPIVELDAPEPFQTEMTVEHFHAGDEVLHIDWIENRTVAAMTRYKRYWGTKTGNTSDDAPWTVDTYNLYAHRVAAAYSQANDGYQADLDEWEEFLLPSSPSPFTARRARAYLFARFERKHFFWGDAVSFFSQATQDTGMYVPNNGHLDYEVWGLTKDRQHTVVGWFRVSHPKLPNWGDHVRDIRESHPDLEREYGEALRLNNQKLIDAVFKKMTQREDENMKKDPAYKLIDSGKPDEFQPSLTAIDKLVGSLRLK